MSTKDVELQSFITSQARAPWVAVAFNLSVALASVVVLFRPHLLADRFVVVTPVTVDLESTQHTIAQSLAVIALVVVARWLLSKWVAASLAPVLTAASAGVAFLVAAYPLTGWLVDDAAITFAYSENLARGHGLVLHTSHPPEEGYSNTLWMLVLTGVRLLGFDLLIAAKVLGVLFGAVSVVATLWAYEKIRPQSDGNSKAVLLAALFGAPLIVWSTSGLEHPLQALLLLTIVIAPLLGTRYVWTQALCFGGLMLLRPETPLLLAAVGAAMLLHGYFAGSTPLLRRALALWPLAVIPTAVFAALLVFRIQYFGDPLPNPYYAKASSANFARLVNFVGGGWDYLYAWLAGSAAMICLPFVVGIDWRKAPLPVWLGAAVVAGQSAFVLYAGGDFMGCWRFVSPMVPALALVVGYAMPSLLKALSPAPRTVLSTVVAGFLVVGSIKQYDVFALAPTAPYDVISKIALEFRALGDRLGLKEPRVAHHDAGGAAYGARLDLVDLAGLGDRTLAKNITDPAFLADYIFNQKRPHIIFGADNNFAAETGYYKVPEFERDYVELRWRDKPFMDAPMSHIRRELADNDEVFEQVYAGAKLVKVIVRE